MIRTLSKAPLIQALLILTMLHGSLFAQSLTWCHTTHSAHYSWQAHQTEQSHPTQHSKSPAASCCSHSHPAAASVHSDSGNLGERPNSPRPTESHQPPYQHSPGGEDSEYYQDSEHCQHQHTPQPHQHDSLSILSNAVSSSEITTQHLAYSIPSNYPPALAYTPLPELTTPRFMATMLPSQPPGTTAHPVVIRC